jgi:branched-chain amino acid transport system permease protein
MTRLALGPSRGRQFCFHFAQTHRKRGKSPIVDLTQLLINTIVLSSFYALFTVGLALVFGTMKMVNFAHGELYMLGGYTLWTLITIFQRSLPLPVSFFLALLIGPLVIGGIGVVIERGIFRPLRGVPLGAFLASFGLAYILQVLAAQAFGTVDKSLPTIFPGQIQVFGGILATQRLVIVIFSIAMMGGLWFFLMRTNFGRGLRATSQNPEAALLQGIGFNKISMLAMGIGSALAAISGVLMGTVVPTGSTMGIEAIWKAFILIIVGGTGSVGGAGLAAVLFGFLDNLVMELGLHRFLHMIDVLIMLVVLAFRPQGLLGREVP